MLYYLFQWLDKYDFPGAGMFGYTSFRALMAIILALLISSIWGDKFIDLLKRKQITETQRDANIDPFGVNKVGVPSMGGVIIIFAILIPCLLLGKLNNIYMILMLITTVWLGSLGFADDYIKIFKKDKEGLHGKFKIIGQVGLGLIVGLTLYLSPQVVIRENIEVEKPGQGIEVVHAAKEIKATQTTIPFFKSNNLDYADLVSFMGEHAQTAGWILFVLVTIFVVTAVSNGANLNDGMDGMAAGNSAIIGLTLGILAYVSSHIEYAGYLNIMYIPGSEELVIFICAFIGALIGFLWYNAYPAQVFMGDTGSLTIGGIIAVYAIIIHKELLIPILCGIFLVENLSVILQRVYYKAGKRKGVKQRLFKRTPIHDHFLPQFLSGLRDGVTCGSPLCAVIYNSDQHSSDYAELADKPRPSHADYTAWVKWGGQADMRGGGHFSGRLTAPLCIAGGIAKQILARRGVFVGAHLAAVGAEDDEAFPLYPTDELFRAVAAKLFPTISDAAGERMQRLILAAREAQDSVGGIVECAAIGLPAGLGDPMFDGMENRLASALFGIPAVKGVEFGAGFGASRLRGSENNDAFRVEDGRIVTETNRAGGILGGITTGMPLTLRVGIKPTPSIGRPQKTVSLARMENTELTIRGRHDPCIAHRAVPVVEAVTACVLLDLLLEEHHGTF